MSLIGTALAGLGISLGSKLISPVFNGIGNLISGGTWKQSGSEIASQDFAHNEAELAHERTMEADNTKYQRAVEDIQEAGLNPNLIYGAGGTPSSTPTSSSASAGSGSRASMQGSMNTLAEMSGLINSVTNARALDFQINKKSTNVTTQRIYDSVGQLVQTLVKTSK